MTTPRRYLFVLLLMGCAALTQQAKSDGFLRNGSPSRESKVTIPATTPLPVKLDEVVSAKTAQGGGGFTVTFTEPVRLDGAIVIPEGATGAGLVSRNAQNGTQMELNSVFVNGRSYRVTTSPISFNQKGALRAGSKFTFDLLLSVNVVE